MPITKAIDWKGGKPLATFLSDYSVYPHLTTKLDSRDWSFSDSIINEIVLWKLGRYVRIPSSTLTELGALKKLKRGEHRSATATLGELLACDGVRLPMASTILRFANPSVFQIYDRHMSRALIGTFRKVAPKKPLPASNLYWEYLDELIRQCDALMISFEDADRILFEYDKAVNPPLSGAAA